MITDTINSEIFRLRIPFEAFTTTVYFYVYNSAVAIIDCSTYASDVDEYIIPAIQSLGLSADDVKSILISHKHLYHIGGLNRLAEICPDAVIGTACDIDLPKVNLTDNMDINGNLKAIALPGHTEDSFGFLDTKSATLLSADCLQLDGVDKYRNGISDFNAYKESVNKLLSMGIKRIVAAHDYIPLGSVAKREEAVTNYLNECILIADYKKQNN